jgi:Mg2+/Co2+ transporter CorB
MPFVKNDERMPMWQQNYDRIIEVLKTENATRVADRQAIARDS